MKGIAPPSPVTRDSNRDVTLTVTCAPKIHPSQRAELLVADRNVAAEGRGADTDTLTFILKNATAVTDALVYLRIDGVDSLPFKRQEIPPPPRLVFDDNQRVTIL